MSTKAFLDPTEVVSLYKATGSLSKVAKKLHTSDIRIAQILDAMGVDRCVKPRTVLLERKPKDTDRSKQSYDDIDRGLRLAPGNKVLTPKGPRIISEVYPYHVIVKTKHGYRESFTKSSLLCCATLKAAGLEYRDEGEK